MACMREDIAIVYVTVMPTMVSLQEWQAILCH